MSDVTELQPVIAFLRADNVAAIAVDRYNTKLGVNPYITRGTQCNFALRLIDADGNPFTLVWLSNFVSWDFVLATDWDTDTPPQVRVQSGITITEVTIDEVVYSQINIPLRELNTDELITALGNNSEISIGAELAGFLSGETTPAFLLQFNINVRNRRGTAGTGTSTQVGDGQYTSAQVDALLAGKVDKVGSSDIEITDPTKGVIFVDTNAVRRRLNTDTDGNPVTDPIA